jgi:hypothetical protein
MTTCRSQIAALAEMSCALNAACAVHFARPGRWRSGMWLEQALVMLLERFMALAGMFLNQRDSHDMHMAAAVGNQPCPLQLSGHLGNAGSSDAHHLREKFLGKGQIDTNEVVHSQEPSAHSRMNVVHRVTSGGLLDLRQEELLIFDEERAELGDRANYFSKSVYFDDRSGTGNLNDDPVERHLVIERLQGAKGTISADHAGFDPLAVFQFDNTGNDAPVREVDLVEVLMGVGKYLALMQLRDGKVRLEAIDIRDAKTRQKAVL